jgi:class 3 adenylate cyclase
MEREVRYCTSADGTRIAYCVYGEGPALVRCPWGWDSFDNELEEFDVMSRLDKGRTVLRYDSRGVGLSQRGAESYAFERMVADIEAVTDAAGLSRFTLYGAVFNSAPAIAYAARHPEKVDRLILERSVVRTSDAMPRENLDVIIGLIRGNWEMATQTLGDLGNRGGEPTLGIRLAETMRQNVEPDDLIAILTDLYETVDVRDLLTDVECPTLIFHRKEDSLIPFAAAQQAAAVIPQARLVPLPGGDAGATFGEDAEANVQTMAAFLDEDPETRALSVVPPPVPASDSAFRTILFTDMEGSTSLTQRLGDAAAQDVLRTHNSIVRDALTAHSGTEIKHTGDGIMASFTSASASLEAAVAIQKALADHNQAHPDAAIRVRIGLNAGEPVAEDEDLFGTAVQLAARVCDKAEPGQILASNVVQELAAGKDFDFTDQGEATLKGFERPVRLHEVRWHD